MVDENDNEFLKEEQENDPAKLQKESVELQREALDFYKGILKEQKAKEGAPYVRPTTYLAAAPVVGRAYPSHPTCVTFKTKKITNGWVLLRARGHEDIYQPEGNIEETYFATIEELTAGVDRAVRLFAAEAMGSDVPAGT